MKKPIKIDLHNPKNETEKIHVEYTQMLIEASHVFLKMNRTRLENLTENVIPITIFPPFAFLVMQIRNVFESIKQSSIPEKEKLIQKLLVDIQETFDTYMSEIKDSI